VNTQRDVLTRTSPSLLATRDSLPPKPAVILGWFVTLSVSLLPDILWQTFTGRVPACLFPSKLILLCGLATAGFFWRPARLLRGYCLMIALLFVADFLFSRLESSSQWQQWFGSGFAGHMFGSQILRLAEAALMILGLLLSRYRPRDFFLRKGDLNAPVGPVRWLGIDKTMRWRKVGLISSLCISLGLLAFLVIGGRPSLVSVIKMSPYLPVVLLLAAMNAFFEEVSFRGALLAPLQGAVTQQQSILLTAVFSGIGHYYGVPYGIVGVIMAGFLGWYLGKCMVETKGVGWPWFIHLLQDVLIFSFMAIGAVTAGGR